MFEEKENGTFSEREERVLKFWREKGIFEKSMKQREGAPYFSFYDGPPFATGLPHYGHLLAGTIKDAVGRYQTMIGKYVPRRFGWDCHGLPVEQEIEKKFNLSGAPSIESFGVAQFNEECRSIVLRYTAEWQKIVERMGRWVDFSATWKTMDITFMESVWWVFSRVYELGLIYEGQKVVPYSAKLGTPLSNFEAAENYREVQDPSIVVAFTLEDEPETSLLIWTTTPWTLISNMAVTVHPELDYVAVKLISSGRTFILAQSTLARWFPNPEEVEILSTFKGQKLIGRRYRPLFPYFAEKAKEGAFRVIGDDFVTIDEGTGLVHTAPAFGESDYFACKKAGVPLVCPVDQNGAFTAEVAEYQGKFVKECDRDVIKRLKVAGHIFYQGQILHRYPYCWRSDTPLIYKAITTWFLNVEKIKERLVSANEKVHWVPDHLKYGRFGKWLEGARDWAISRNRYWGTPIPIWKSEDGEIHLVKSIKELEELTGAKITDLHRHNIDALTFVKNGKRFTRIPEVFDCWFDAGSMPYGQNHYPFENRELTEKTLPADFIAEGVDQTRGWFYTLLILSVALFDKPAYRNVVTNGIILTEEGAKMSKRLKNYPEVEGVISKYGADSIRLYLLASPAVRADDLCFSVSGVELVLRQILIPLFNAQTFFSTYAKIYNFKPDFKLFRPKAILDRWILSRLTHLTEEVREGMEHYDLNRAVEPFVGFIDELTNWYIRRSRRRFWEEKDPADQKEAFETLYRVLITLSKLSAPFIPFVSELLFQKLRMDSMKESVHLEDFPPPESLLRDDNLEKGMESLQLIVSLGHALRKENKLKVRQPLKALHLVSSDLSRIPFIDEHKGLIADELNVKEVIFHKEKREFMKYSIKPNYRLLGAKAKEKMKALSILINNLTQEEIGLLQEGKSAEVILEKESFTLLPEEVEIKPVAKEGWAAIHAGLFTIALDTKLDKSLILEGIARELINKINTMRREANFEVTDRIRVHLEATDLVREALAIHGDYVKEEVLAISMDFESVPGATSWDINGEAVTLFVEKV